MTKGFPIHPAVEEAIQQIDAALFNGDTFDDPENRTYLKDYIMRWLEQIKNNEAFERSNEQELPEGLNEMEISVMADFLRSRSDR